MNNEYPAPYVLTIKVLDGINFLIGLSILSYPLLHHFYPGDYDTTIHVALGALIAICAIFRVLIAYGSAWLDVVLCAFGVIVFLAPWFQHMTYDPGYNAFHKIAGVILIVSAIISAALTFSQLRKQRRLAH